MKNLFPILVAACAATLFPLTVSAQVNSGSNGSDGALNPTANLVIDMADHPDGIYHYTSVNIPAGVTVSFIPNAGNKPVVWLVQGDCVIAGTLHLAGNHGNITPGEGGPGGFAGGASGASGAPAHSGRGPGGGYAAPTVTGGGYGGNASHASAGQMHNDRHAAPGALYGNTFTLPFQGGSGGGGSYGFAHSGAGEAAPFWLPLLATFSSTVS